MKRMTDYATMRAEQARTARPANLGVLNRWLAKQPWATDGEKTARLARHYESDGGQLYWYDYPGPMFYIETVECIHRADDMTFAEWEADFRERVARAKRGW